MRNLSVHSDINDFLGVNNIKDFDLIKFFDVLEELFHFRNFQLITKDKDKGILWFFGNEIRSGYDILVLTKIRINMIEIMILSKDPIYFVPFFFTIIQNLKEQLQKFVNLECINCGSILPYFPKKEETIVCNKCYHKQIFW